MSCRFVLKSISQRARRSFKHAVVLLSRCRHPCVLQKGIWDQGEQSVTLLGQTEGRNPTRQIGKRQNGSSTALLSCKVDVKLEERVCCLRRTPKSSPVWLKISNSSTLSLVTSQHASSCEVQWVGWNSYCLRTASLGMLRTMETVCIAVSGGSEPLGA